MATVNPYFQSGGTIGRSSEQNLYEDLMIESMKIYGFEVYYLPRKSNSLDSILSEDPLNTFDYAFPIEMYLENTMGFQGDGELMSKFGLEIRDTGNFIVSRRRWTDVIGSQNVTILPRPAEGDIIFFPKSKSFFEIRKVEGQEPFYQIGKLYVFKIDPCVSIIKLLNATICDDDPYRLFVTEVIISIDAPSSRIKSFGPLGV